ncbi:hypothetical protein BZB76_0036 [Actinomadura pelletieri DSM 43383]|uniref:DUF6879 domain-containing protein n=1 Tax=Actinomadura pelletieri DSM 43383 TaxID=1120940 RepID=A0A495QWR7_9ACTN|nr:DUF6879 family protein [Actinomadura pelletieri]RKS78619.1 hypothetical protein BZB76_0036 [Actinomadura pelletieri DSM 43383]
MTEDIEFVGETDQSPQGKCPAVWRDKTGLYVRGKTVTDPVVLARLARDNEEAADESTVWLANDMIPKVAEAAAGTFEPGRTGHGPVTVYDLLRQVQRSALHLEMRDTYDASAPAFHDWLAGGPGDLDWTEWNSIVSSAVERGAEFRRARIVSEPVTDYIAWEHMLTEHNIKAGEDVRWLPRRRAFDLMLPGADFWLLDHKLVAFNFCSGDGTDTEEEEFTSDPDTVARCLLAFERVWERAIPHAEYKPPRRSAVR